jgi:hypothetical protein
MKKEFKIGDEVVSLSNTPNANCQIRVEGKKYVVLDTMYLISLIKSMKNRENK